MKSLAARAKPWVTGVTVGSHLDLAKRKVGPREELVLWWPGFEESDECAPGQIVPCDGDGPLSDEQEGLG